MGVEIKCEVGFGFPVIDRENTFNKGGTERLCIETDSYESPNPGGVPRKISTGFVVGGKDDGCQNGRGGTCVGESV